MSKTEKIQAEIKKLQGELKEERAKEIPFYIITDKGVVVMKKSENPAKSCARWIGESGSKTLKTEGDFVERLTKHSKVTGKTYYIKPLLKELGYKFEKKDKSWNLPVQAPAPVDAVDVKDGNPLV